MTLDKHEQQVVKDVLEELRLLEPLHVTVHTHIVALEAILPKPRFYVNGRYVYDRHDRSGALYVNDSLVPDDAIAVIIAQDFADVLNKRLGEEA